MDSLEFVPSHAQLAFTSNSMRETASTPSLIAEKLRDIVAGGKGDLSTTSGGVVWTTNLVFYACQLEVA